MFNANLPETLDFYLYDHYPEREIQTWEIMNATFLDYINEESIKNLNLKKEVAKQIILFSMGTLEKETILSHEQLTRLYEIWKLNYYPF